MITNKQIVPPPSKLPGRPRSFHTLNSIQAPVVPPSSSPDQSSPLLPPASPPSGDEIPSSFQAIAAQLGASANFAKVSDLESNQGSQLREVDHQGWTCLAEVQLPDLSIWFEHQVRGTLSHSYASLTTKIYLI